MPSVGWILIIGLAAAVLLLGWIGWRRAGGGSGLDTEDGDLLVYSGNAADCEDIVARLEEAGIAAWSISELEGDSHVLVDPADGPQVLAFLSTLGEGV